MNYSFLTTNNLSNLQLEGLRLSFNNVFEKEYLIEYFSNKYTNTIKTYSYHSLMEANNAIVGGCTFIPYEYFYNEKNIIVALAVDLFIEEESRVDPLAMLRMYKGLKKMMIEDGIHLVIAVPNEVSYPYWKKALKWKDIGQLPYYALPIRLDLVVRKRNFIFAFFSKLVVAGLKGISTLELLYHNPNSTQLPIQIRKDNSILQIHRFFSTGDICYNTFKDENIFFTYRSVVENNIRASYLIDFSNTKNNTRDYSSLFKSVNYIIQNDKPDLILYIGNIGFNQNLLIKIPKKYEPRPLNLIGEALSNEFNTPFTWDFANWDFSLFNYDVR